MSFITLDMKELKDRWMKLYVNLNLVMSSDSKEMEILSTFKDKLAVYNEEFMAFFDAMEDIPKVSAPGQPSLKRLLEGFQ